MTVSALKSLRAAGDVLTAVAARFGHSVDTSTHLMGGAALRAGLPALPPETLAACKAAPATLIGAVGDSAFDHLPSKERPEGALLAPSQGPRRVRQSPPDPHLAGSRGRARR